MRRVLIRMVALAMVLTACSASESGEPAATIAVPTTTPAPTTTEAAASTTIVPATTAAPVTTVASSEGVVVGVAAADLGDILTDDAGFTLYVFMPDEQGESVCYDECEAAWPPLVAASTGGAGVDSGLLGISARTDGSSQVTYNGWPLYYFANDLEPGETNGQGVNDVWYVVDASGEPVR